MECHRLKIVVSYHNVSRHILNLKLKPMSVGLLALLLLQIKCLVGGYRLSPNSSVKKLLASSIMHVPLKCSVSYGENNFGDIMGGCETSVSVIGSFAPMERVVLSANGNLQRIMSAYYGAPVTVQVLKCDPIGPMTFHREVNLIVKNNIFCTAIGSIELYSEECKKAVEERNIGVGQLFRFLGILPSFKLLTAGRNDQGALYREYELSCPQIRCRFVETFSLDFLEPLEQFETVYGVSLPPPTAQNTHRSNINDALTETGTAINGKVE